MSCINPDRSAALALAAEVAPTGKGAEAPASAKASGGWEECEEKEGAKKLCNKVNKEVVSVARWSSEGVRGDPPRARGVVIGW